VVDMTLQQWAATSVVLGAILTALTLVVTVSRLSRPLRRLARQNEEFRQDWYGTPARPGHDAVPGVPERLRRIEKELHPHGAGTLRDAVNDAESRLKGVETRLDDHLRSHHGGAAAR
jgi:HAMP domain-containing protein